MVGLSTTEHHGRMQYVKGCPLLILGDSGVMQGPPSTASAACIVRTRHSGGSMQARSVTQAAGQPCSVTVPPTGSQKHATSTRTGKGRCYRILRRMQCNQHECTRVQRMRGHQYAKANAEQEFATPLKAPWVAGKAVAAYLGEVGLAG